VVDLDADALAAELAGDLLSHGDAPVTAAPAGDVNASEDGLHLKGVDSHQCADAVNVEGDDAVRSGGFQDVGRDLRVWPGAVAKVGVGMRVAQSLTQVDQQRVAVGRCGAVQCPVGGDYGPDHWYSAFAT